MSKKIAKSSHLIIFGAQGSGKGTQAELISRAGGLVYISTGDIFRQEIENQTKLGKKINSLMKKGALVPDRLTNQIIKERLSQKDCQKKGFVLDGYPRNQNQLNFLDSIIEISDVIVIKISDQEAIKRLAGRLACICGLSYHQKHNPPKVKGVCDKCGSKLFIRDDDKPEAIKKRLVIYHQQTKPLFESYKKRGILREINGEQSIKKVFEEIVRVLGLRCKYPKE